MIRSDVIPGPDPGISAARDPRVEPEDDEPGNRETCASPGPRGGGPRRGDPRVGICGLWLSGQDNASAIHAWQPDRRAGGRPGDARHRLMADAVPRRAPRSTGSPTPASRRGLRRRWREQSNRRTDREEIPGAHPRPRSRHRGEAKRHLDTVCDRWRTMRFHESGIGPDPHARLCQRRGVVVGAGRKATPMCCSGTGCRAERLTIREHHSDDRSTRAGRAASGRQAKARPASSVASAPPRTMVVAETHSKA